MTTCRRCRTPGRCPRSYRRGSAVSRRPELAAGAELARAATGRFAVPAGAPTHELIVTHAFLIGWFVRHALDAPDDRWLGLNHANCAVTTILYRRARPPALMVFNDQSHLPPALRWTGFPPDLTVPSEAAAASLRRATGRRGRIACLPCPRTCEPTAPAASGCAASPRRSRRRPTSPSTSRPGRPCPNLLADFRCGIHADLRPRGFAGCTVYDCFGAGQRIAQVTFGGRSWQDAPETAPRMFAAFAVMRHLHELLWYLAEALTLRPARRLHGELTEAPRRHRAPRRRRPGRPARPRHRHPPRWRG